MRTKPVILFLSCCLAGCQLPAGGEPVRPAFSAPANAPWTFDGHNDVAIHYLRTRPPWSLAAHDMASALPGQSDIPRWRAGGVGGALITVGSDRPPGSGAHFPRLLASLDWFDALVRRYPADLVQARRAQDLRAARRSGRLALVPAIEGGDQLDNSLANLRVAYQRGVRSMTIVYDHHNAIGDGAMVMAHSHAIAHAPHGGLSTFGRAMVAEMNRLGMLVDLSHASDATALQAMAISRAPVIFSHSGARALADTPRNLSDAALRAVAANGGVVMVTLVPFLTTTAHWRWWSSGEARYAQLQASHPDDEAEVNRGMAEWDRANPQPAVTIEQVADQIEYIARVAGPDHVGIGTDFDGMGSHVVDELRDASRLPLLYAELARRGWSRQRLDALAGGNFERVLSGAEAVAR